MVEVAELLQDFASSSATENARECKRECKEFDKSGEHTKAFQIVDYFQNVDNMR